jgi:hypothetical protein
MEMLKWYQETCDVVQREFDARRLTAESIQKQGEKWNNWLFVLMISATVKQ